MRVKLLLLTLVGVLVWANWNVPQMHHFVEPVTTVVWQLPRINDPIKAQALEATLAKTPGVKACAVSWHTSCVAFVYHPDQVTPVILAQALKKRGVDVILNGAAPASAPAMRQCPVPPGYELLIDQIRFTLNIRRFLVAV